MVWCCTKLTLYVNNKLNLQNLLEYLLERKTVKLFLLNKQNKQNEVRKRKIKQLENRTDDPDNC